MALGYSGPESYATGQNIMVNDNAVVDFCGVLCSNNMCLLADMMGFGNACRKILTVEHKVLAAAP